MNSCTPKYLLFSEPSGGPRGTWKFVLRSIHGSECLEASDDEPGVCGERLELLTVVRGLEALDQPSKVTLVTPSKYVREGIRYGLREWRSNGWRWEYYGEMVPVKNRDLWQRIDRALRFHEVDCRRWRFDRAHTSGVVRRPSVGCRSGTRANPDEVVEDRGTRPEQTTRPRGIRVWAAHLVAAIGRIVARCSWSWEGLAGKLKSG